MNSYRFFRNYECEYFPCHKCDDDTNFSCLFCYCPLYKSQCNGNYIMTNGIKDCTNCTIPHFDYDYIIGRLKQ